MFILRPDHRTDEERGRKRKRAEPDCLHPRCRKQGRRGWQKGFCASHATAKGIACPPLAKLKIKERDENRKKRTAPTQKVKPEDAGQPAQKVDDGLEGPDMISDAESEFAWCDDLVRRPGREATFTEEVLQRSWHEGWWMVATRQWMDDKMQNQEIYEVEPRPSHAPMTPAWRCFDEGTDPKDQVSVTTLDQACMIADKLDKSSITIAEEGSRFEDDLLREVDPQYITACEWMWVLKTERRSLLDDLESD
jgi:hypothetical protein